MRAWIPLVASAAVALVAGGFLINHVEVDRDLRMRAESISGGNVERGKHWFAVYGCGGCHSLKGVPGAHGLVGPPLDGIATRTFLAGHLENRPQNLRLWIEHPQHASPGTAMPELGVRPGHARDISALLYDR